MRLLPDKIGLCELEQFYGFRKFDQMLQFVIITNKPVIDPATGPDDKARNADKGIEKALKFHTHYR